MIRLVVRTDQQYREALRRLEKAYRERTERGLMVTLEEYRPPATNKQQTKLVLMLNELADATGNDPAIFRGWFREHHVQPRALRLRNTETLVVPEFRQLTRAEASDCIEKVHVLAHELGITLDG